MAKGFIVLAKLIKADAQDSKWISFVDLRNNPNLRFRLRDPSYDWIDFPIPSIIDNCAVDNNDWLLQFVTTFSLMTERMAIWYTLVVVLGGHGQKKGVILLVIRYY